jgi:hypothetical protein
MHGPRARNKELGKWLNPRTRHCGLAKGPIERQSSEKTFQKGVVPLVQSGCNWILVLLPTTRGPFGDERSRHSHPESSWPHDNL